MITKEEAAEFLLKQPWAVKWAESMCKVVFGDKWKEMPEEERKEYIRGVIYRKLAPSLIDEVEEIMEEQSKG